VVIINVVRQEGSYVQCFEFISDLKRRSVGASHIDLHLLDLFTERQEKKLTNVLFPDNKPLPTFYKS